MNVYVITASSCCGSNHVLGVFDSWEAVMHRLSWLGEHTDPGEEYNIECFELKDVEETASQAADILSNRARIKRERELIAANTNHNTES